LLLSRSGNNVYPGALGSVQKKIMKYKNQQCSFLDIETGFVEKKMHKKSS
jgi:hypothetical protein